MTFLAIPVPLQLVDGGTGSGLVLVDTWKPSCLSRLG